MTFGERYGVGASALARGLGADQLRMQDVTVLHDGQRYSGASWTSIEPREVWSPWNRHEKRKQAALARRRKR